LIATVSEHGDTLATHDNAIEDLNEAVTAIIGDSANDTKDTPSLVGVKKYVDDKAATLLGASTDTEDKITLYGVKAYATKAIGDTKAELNNNISENTEAIAKLTEAVGKTTNVMNFRGVVTSLDVIDNPEAGDVCIVELTYPDPENTEKTVTDYQEYVYDGEAWQELGPVDINAKRLSKLELDVNGLKNADVALKDLIDINSNDIDVLEGQVENLENTAESINKTIGYVKADSVEEGGDEDTTKTVLALIKAERATRINAISDLNDDIEGVQDSLEAYKLEVEEMLSWGEF
jgi:hypothetical protein